ncbi:MULTISPECIES: prolipoprotein diacylglyceryl transferase [unclassified Fusibacter]|uniref:prolipoprotein diacylglyceryl transferase n=1 Tax=unclassified Fusibacter TaxID=2624464 RepID=UPI00101127AE|nr:MULTISPECIES: prolipoprotein diacylglyceryl transferase [unclassified Fusibacter]MCK8058360.1 prolipoprotein diacylglyceryl transferase [Fusibacter sp. A2]NPE20943.1 prolipoprotein diacylglyceryl transferase [Fusibacter sp. A1]RXV63145.1 prolipoprotein diacylglyceryl transferase [Fusibacter sp. A1]
MDKHILLAPQGFMPTFEIAGFSLSSYTFFIILALVCGAVVLKLANAQREDGLAERKGDESLIIASAALIGGTIGAKLPILIYYWGEIIRSDTPLIAMLSGRTILGGMIGGLLAVILVKRRMNLKTRFGNQLAPAVAFGMAVGRIGCFFQGCCVGIATHSAFGIDFGDHVLRHPTQLYEVAFHLIMFLLLWNHPLRKRDGGELLSSYFIAYFLIRFLEEYIREINEAFWGLSMYQWLCLLGMIFLVIKAKRRRAIDQIQN